MTENFSELLQESWERLNMAPGSIITAKVLLIDNDYVTVGAGLKSEGIIPLQEFYSEEGTLEVNVGDDVEVALEAAEDGFGETILSRERAKRMETWRELEKAYEAGSAVTGMITDKVKGGFTVAINKVRAFLPGSLVDVRPVRDTSYLEGKPLEFKVIKMDSRRNNIVVSRRAIVQAGSSVEREALLESLAEGKEIKGVVKNLTDYGAFIDLGGIDGLLHITDISWRRVKHPSEILNVGDDVNVKILKFDRERNRVSLGMKQLGEDPWLDLAERYPEHTRLNGKVTNITDYGCFVEIEPGVEGLVHMSEMDWTNKNIHPSKVVSLGQPVDVLVLEIDKDRRRISLGMKQCADNPWDAFSKQHQKGDKISGKIKSITDFGIFIGLAGGIDGLIHLSDLSWEEAAEQSARDYKKGQEVEAVILSIDADRERISLGIKQMADDPFSMYAELNPKNTIVTGKVIEVDAKAAQVELADQVVGVLLAKEMSTEKVTDATTVFKVGDDVEAKIINIDRKTRVLNLSIKAKDVQDEADALKKYRSDKQDAPTGTTLGDILKEKIDSKGEDAS